MRGCALIFRELNVWTRFHVIYPEYNLHFTSPLTCLPLTTLFVSARTLTICILTYFFTLGDTHMTKTRKRDVDTSTEMPRRNTRSRVSTTTSSSSRPLEKVNMKLPALLKPKSPDIKSGPGAWDSDLRELKKEWKKGEVEGYGGLVATITGTSGLRVEAEGRF